MCKQCFGYSNEKQNVQRNSDEDVHDNCMSEDLQRDSSISHPNNQYLSDSHCLPNSSRAVSLRSLSVMCPCTDDVAFPFTSKEKNVLSNNLNHLNHNTCNGMCRLTQCDRLTSNSLAAWNDVRHILFTLRTNDYFFTSFQLALICCANLQNENFLNWLSEFQLIWVDLCGFSS